MDAASISKAVSHYLAIVSHMPVRELLSSRGKGMISRVFTNLATLEANRGYTAVHSEISAYNLDKHIYNAIAIVREYTARETSWSLGKYYHKWLLGNVFRHL